MVSIKPYLDLYCFILGILAFLSNVVFILPFFIDMSYNPFSNILAYIASGVLLLSTIILYPISIIAIKNRKNYSNYKLGLIIAGMILGVIPLLYILLGLYILISTNGKGLWIH